MRSPCAVVAWVFLAGTVAGCGTLAVTELRWVRDTSTAADASADRAACLEALASTSGAGAAGDTSVLERALADGRRHEQVAACMRARGWDLDPRDARENAGQRMDRARS